MDHPTAPPPGPHPSGGFRPTLSGTGLSGAGLSVISDPATSGPAPALSPAQASVLAASERLRQELAATQLPFAVPGAAEALRERDAALDRLDTFVLPRLRRTDAPLLVVVGGSAGSGKSTLTNSLVGVRVSPEGVLRPTTRAPVLAHHPRDAGAFLSRRILPGLARTTGAGGEVAPGDAAGPVQQAPGSLRLVPHWAVAPGLAVIDSPDLNSHVAGNRELAQQLFGVADLWVFVATPTDYANAAPWELLGEAVERQVSVAVVLNRARDAETGEIRHHFATMLRDTGLASAAFFTIPETALDDGLIPSWRMVSLQTWLSRQVSDARTRDGHVRRAVTGTLTQVSRRCEELVGAVEVQAGLVRGLREDLDAALAPGRARLRQRIEDGSLIASAVEAGWQELAGAGSAVPGWQGRRRGRGAGSLRASQVQAVDDALRAAVTGAVLEQARAAADRLADRWHGRPSIAELADAADLFTLPADLAGQAERALAGWQRAVAERAERAGGPATEGGGERAPGAGAAVQILAVGAEAGWIGPPAQAVAAAQLSRSELTGQVRRAREELTGVLGGLLAAALAGPQGLLAELGTSEERPRALRAAMLGVREAVTGLT